MKDHYTDEGPELSEQMKKKFREALKGKLDIVECRDCPQSRGFVQVVNFLIENWIEAIHKIDKATQTMEEFIELTKQLEEREMKLRMLGDDGR